MKMRICIPAIMLVLSVWMHDARADSGFQSLGLRVWNIEFKIDNTGRNPIEGPLCFLYYDISFSGAPLVFTIMGGYGEIEEENSGNRIDRYDAQPSLVYVIEYFYIGAAYHFINYDDEFWHYGERIQQTFTLQSPGIVGGLSLPLGDSGLSLRASATWLPLVSYDNKDGGETVDSDGHVLEGGLAYEIGAFWAGTGYRKWRMEGTEGVKGQTTDGLYVELGLSF